MQRESYISCDYIWQVHAVKLDVYKIWAPIHSQEMEENKRSKIECFIGVFRIFWQGFSRLQKIWNISKWTFRRMIRSSWASISESSLFKIFHTLGQIKSKKKDERLEILGQTSRSSSNFPSYLYASSKILSHYDSKIRSFYSHHPILVNSQFFQPPNVGLLFDIDSKMRELQSAIADL